MSHWLMFQLQDPNSPFSENLLFFYNFVMIMITLILFLTLYLMSTIIFNVNINRFMIKNHNIEIIWTIIPILILMFIALPSLKMLYYIDEMWKPIFFTIKAIGNQWFWSYEYDEFNISFDSFMEKSNLIFYKDKSSNLLELNNKELFNFNNKHKINHFRLLDVDNRMVIPFNIPIRIITTSIDVIHSWTVPSLGIKMDSIPGRLNQMILYGHRPGIYYGQCSEICGVNHSFMPISIELTNLKNFYFWVNKMI